MPRALIVEDHHQALKNLSDSFEKIDFQVDGADNPNDALKLLHRPIYNAIVIDTGVASTSRERADYSLAIEAEKTNPQALLVAITQFYSTQFVKEANNFFDIVRRLNIDRTDYLVADIQHLLSLQTPAQRARNHLKL